MQAHSNETYNVSSEFSVKTFKVDNLLPSISRIGLSSEGPRRTTEPKQLSRDEFRAKLRERWSCDEADHDLCWRDADNNEHVPLSESQIEQWIDAWVGGFPSVTTQSSHNISV